MERTDLVLLDWSFINGFYLLTG